MAVRYLILCLMMMAPEFSAAASQKSSEKSSQERLLVLTEKTPINYDSKIEPSGRYGEATKFVEAVLKHADIHYQLRFMPWKRIYHQGLTEPNRLIYPMARTQEREALFHWVGRITPVHYYLFKRADFEPDRSVSLADLTSARIGVVNLHAHHQFLLAEGFTALQPVNYSYLNLRKLMAGRIDYLVMSSAGLKTLCQKEQVDCKALKPAVKLDGISTGLFMALSKGSDAKLLTKIRASFEALVANGERNRILNHRANDAHQDRFLRAFSEEE